MPQPLLLESHTEEAVYIYRTLDMTYSSFLCPDPNKYIKALFHSVESDYWIRDLFKVN